ncbi:hypothetical protein TIFTF001_020362 [Ficus carica]|uniref:Uncharacterized protein n=1 Tax=Ficus carica TaxID=3494 RepID=A0AA88DDL1_FICCA|nr:hypothetical protein TIFTF001_020362 [Ficus carica]
MAAKFAENRLLSVNKGNSELTGSVSSNLGMPCSSNRISWPKQYRAGSRETLA